MRRVLVIGSMVATVLAVAATVAAKGPSGATITGPGIEEPIVLEVEDPELWALTTGTGFAQLVFGLPAENGTGPLKMPPVGEQQRRYVVTFHMPDGDYPLEVFLRADLGPIADDPRDPWGPLVHVSHDIDPGLFDHGRSFSWFKPTPGLTNLMYSIGVPIRAPEEAISASPEPAGRPAAVPLVIAALSAAAFIAVVRRARPRSLAG